MKKFHHVWWFATLLFVLRLVDVAQAETLEHYQLQQGALHLQLQQGAIRIKPLSNHAVEVRYRHSTQKENQNEHFPSFALADENELSALPKAFQLAKQKTYLNFASPSLQIRVNTRPFGLQFWQGEKLLSEHDSGFFEQRTLRGVRFKLQPHEKIMGGGQRVLGMDRRGYRLPLKSQTHWGYTDHSEVMYYSLPAILSTQGYGILFDNSAVGHLDIGKSEPDILQFEAVSGRNAYLFVTGDNLPDVTRQIVAVTGKQPLPPRWAFGNLSSRFGYRTEQEVRSVVSAYQEQDFPLDAMILDLYWFGKEMKGHMGSLDWERKTFPTGEQMISDLIEQNIKTILITEPFFINTSKQWQSGIDNNIFAQNLAGDTRIIDMYFGNAGLIDVFQPHAREWFWQHYQRLFKQGMAGVWGDLGEPEAHPENTVHLLNSQPVTANEVHNAFGHEWAHLIADNYRNFAPNQRLFMLMRSGFLGSQRFGLMPWTGDVSRSWGGLASQVELSLQMSLFGLAYTHSDLGGFAGHDEFDAELYIRWLQYGVFQPVYRLHGIESVASEPIYHDKATQNIVRQAIKWRYRLLPYHYTMAYQNSSSGMPLMRPHFYDAASETSLSSQTSQTSDNTYATKNAYFWGDAFWVQPITRANTSSVKVTLPSGHWFDFWRGGYYHGQNQGRNQGLNQHKVAVDIDHIPVFVKAGSFVPMAFSGVDKITTTEQYQGKRVALHYYHHPAVTQSTGEWYEDDGKAANAIATQQFRLYQLSSSANANSLTLNARATGKGYATEPEVREVSWVIHNVKQLPKHVTVAGSKVQSVFDPQQHTVTVNTQITPATQNLTLNIVY